MGNYWLCSLTGSILLLVSAVNDGNMQEMLFQSQSGLWVSMVAICGNLTGMFYFYAYVTV